MQRGEQSSPWAYEAESFLLDGRAMWHLRNPATIMLAAVATMGDRFNLGNEPIGSPVLDRQAGKAFDKTIPETFEQSEVGREPDAFLGVAIAYPDPVYQQTMRLGSMCVDNRIRGSGVGAALFTALVVESHRLEPYAIWLVHSSNMPMLRLCRKTKLAAEEVEAADGYIQFFAER